MVQRESGTESESTTYCLHLKKSTALVSKVNPFSENKEVSVDIENVTFSYTLENTVLNQLSLSIPAG